MMPTKNCHDSQHCVVEPKDHISKYGHNMGLLSQHVFQDFQKKYILDFPV